MDLTIEARGIDAIANALITFRHVPFSRAKKPSLTLSDDSVSHLLERLTRAHRKVLQDLVATGLTREEAWSAGKMVKVTLALSAEEIEATSRILKAILEEWEHDEADLPTLVAPRSEVRSIWRQITGSQAQK